MRKKKVLFFTEATYLNTGYAVYGKEIIPRLLDLGHDVAEYSIYGAEEDPRRKSIPWKNYPVAVSPSDTDEAKQFYSSNPVNQFGAWRFERAALDFKPDCVIDQRDPWMCSFVRHSPFRKLFSWAWMATVDAMPQNSEWIDHFASTDYFLTLTDWAGNLVKEQGGHKVNYWGAAPPGTSPEFRPLPKTAHRISMGINPEWKIIGTVMRNQRRKLFPELFESFSKYIHENDEKDTYLYCHTSYPDNGWDIPLLLKNNNISSRVLFTYCCESCKDVSIGKFSDSLRQCKKCREFSCKPSNVTTGVSTKQLADIYNLFDLYYQCANSEGLGFSQPEAAACGVPVMSTDYSAMSDVVRKLKGYPVPLKCKTLEMETGCYRAIPDIDAAVDYFKHFFSLSGEDRDILSSEARKSCLAEFDWDKASENWSRVINDCSYGKWDSPIRQVGQVPDMPKFVNNKQFLDWSIDTYIPYSDAKNSFESSCLLRDLNFKTFKNNSCGYFYSEMSYFNREQSQPFSKEHVTRMLEGKKKSFNFWESARQNPSLLKDESWL